MRTTTIRALIQQTKGELEKIGITAKAIEGYQCYGFNRILEAHLDQGIMQYSSELTKRLYENIRNNRSGDNKRLLEIKLRVLRKTAALLEEYSDTGTLKWKRLSPCSLRMPCDEYSELLNSFCDHAVKVGMFKPANLCSFRGAVRSFLFELEDVGIYSFDKVTPRVINERITHMSQRYSGGLSTALCKVRTFLKYLYSNDFVKQDLSTAIPESVSRRRTVRRGFTDNETEVLLSQADRKTSMGIRDYAIMIIAAQTGLRACDIASLQRQDIDWHRNELRIVQKKTGRALTLPLPTESGNAMAEYLLNARPECDEPYVFLREKRPYRRMHNSSMNGIVSRYILKANLAGADVRVQGFHSFRRAFGRRLPETETPLDMLSELLGHRDHDSAKQYMAIDEKGLKLCGLSLVAHGGDLE